MKNTYLFLLILTLLFISCQIFESKNNSKEEELNILKELRRDLVQNLDDINSNISSLEISENANRLTIELIENGTSYHDSLDYHFANLYPYLVFSPNETTYNYLKQIGMNSISNDSLRGLISDLYGVEYGVYKNYESIYFVEHYTNYIKPMFIAEFETFKFYRSFKPKNYNNFIENKKYKQVLSYSADACESFRFLQTNLKEKVESVLSAIEKEIKE